MAVLGSTRDMCLPDLLAAQINTRRSCDIHLDAGSARGLLRVRRGSLVQVRFQEQSIERHGCQALRSMLALREASFRIERVEHPAGTEIG